MQENGDELASILKLILYDVQNLIGCVIIEVFMTVGQQVITVRDWHCLGQQQHDRGEVTSSVQQTHNVAAKQEDCEMLGGKVVKGNRDQVRWFTLRWADNY